MLKWRPLHNGDVAQLGEHWLCKPRVEGSSPFVSTKEYSQVVSLFGSRPASCSRGDRSGYFTVKYAYDETPQSMPLAELRAYARTRHLPAWMSPYALILYVE